MDWTTELDNIAKREKSLQSKSGELSANAWRMNDCGSAAPATCSFDTIFSAYNDFKMSLNWN